MTTSALPKPIQGGSLGLDVGPGGLDHLLGGLAVRHRFPGLLLAKKFPSFLLTLVVSMRMAAGDR